MNEGTARADRLRTSRMSLFGDLPQAKAGPSGSTSQAWAAPQLQPVKRKPSVPFAPPAAVLGRGRGAGRGAGPPPVGGRGRGSASADAASTSAPDATAAAAGPSTSNIFAMHGHIQDEYDPMRPNEYEEVLKERERRKKDADAEAERQAKLKQLEAVVARLTQQDPGATLAGPGGTGAGAGPGSAAAAPAAGEARQNVLDISGEEAFLRRGRMGRPGTAAAAPAPAPAAGLGAGSGLGAALAGAEGAGAEDLAPKGMTLAQKMLEKMGWKEGEGLGRNRQGMSTPLMAQKTDRRSGVIVNAEPAGPFASKARPAGALEFGGEPADKRPKLGSALVGKPSRVICLRNMVGPGEVDEELEDEVGNELTKYGNVTSVMIFEVTTPGYAAEEAVRIFIQFDRVEAATKAQVDLQGRFFGGRTVRVAFFDEGRFERTELAPLAGEFD